MDESFICDFFHGLKIFFQLFWFHSVSKRYLNDNRDLFILHGSQYFHYSNSVPYLSVSSGSRVYVPIEGLR